MASLVVNAQPQILVPVYNDSYYQVSSVDSVNPLFNFIFDVYSGYGISNYTRIIAPLGPDGNCYFSPFSILKDFVGCDLIHDLTGVTNSTFCAMNYKIYIGVQYAINYTTGVTQYTGLTIQSGYSWNAAARYEQFSSLYNYVDYLPSGSTSNYLTNMPDIVPIQDGEMASLSILGFPKGTSIPFGLMTVMIYHTSGGTSQYNTFFSGSSFPNDIVIHMGTGIWNINQLTSGTTTYVTGPQYYPIFNPNTDYKYTIQAWYYDFGSGSSGPLTKLQTYLLDQNPQPYQPIRLMWLNPMGAFDYYTFKLVNRLEQNITRNTYKQNLSIPNYQLGDRGTTTTYNNIQEGMIINSDWVDNDTSIWMEDLFNSPEVYMLNPDGTIYPIILMDQSQEIKRYMNDKELVQYTLNFNFAYTVNVQQGSNIRSKTTTYKNANGGPHAGTYPFYENRGGYVININNTSE